MRTAFEASLLGVLLWLPSQRGLMVQGTRPGAAAPKPQTANQLWTLDATYRDARHGVIFRYPTAWTPGLQYGYWPPLLTQSNDPEPIASFGIETNGNEPGPYQHTTLEGFGIVYAATAALDAAACEAIAARVADTTTHTTQVFDGRQFSQRKTDAGGISQSMSGDLYSTFAYKTCYLFELGKAAMNDQVADDFEAEDQAGENAPAVFLHYISEAQATAINTGFRNIMQSSRIKPPKP